MDITFFKYQGTGNDFVMIDNRTKGFPKQNTATISKICDRHFGIGADGIILIENDSEFDFRMVYFNPDGSETFCGNGGRCAVAFAKHLRIFDLETNLIAFDGAHFAKFENETVSLQMIDVTELEVKEKSVFANTGTQHHVELVKDLDTYPVFKNGQKIRNSYPEPGSNVNFVEQINRNTFKVRTYEKGVENETLACGTGVTAVAIAMHKTKKTVDQLINLPVIGGDLQVSFDENEGKYTNVFLKGPAAFVYKGFISI
jgi:diaminopimelate epimerase